MSIKYAIPANDIRREAGLLAAVAALLVFIYWDAVAYMVGFWLGSEEYSHGILLPFVAAYFLYQKRQVFAAAGTHPLWPGGLLLALGLLAFLVGELSSLYIIIQYSLLLSLAGLLLLRLGPVRFREVFPAFFILFFVIPLPQFLYNNLSSQLQLLSSQIGVLVIRVFGISVFLEGNVIDLGSYKLQVVEACSGLRYLFPLMSFAYISAYIFRAPLWMKALVFLSSLPMTVLMNSFRIGVIGVLVEYWGIGAAEGFLHDFEGWIIFMACTGLLFLEIWLLNRWFIKAPRLQDVFVLQLPERSAVSVAWVAGTRGAVLALVMLLAAAGAYVALGQRAELIPERTPLAAFPHEVGAWQGSRDRIDDLTLNVLKLTDYVIADYRNAGGRQVNFYVAYYQSQRKGESAHSPRSCIPGGGWRINDFRNADLPQVAAAGGGPLRVNRLEIQLGDSRQLVYYWFQQRGRVITSEYMVKWYLFWDALTRNRTDGALVRLTTVIGKGDDATAVEGQLVEFAAAMEPLLSKFVPE